MRWLGSVPLPRPLSPQEKPTDAHGQHGPDEHGDCSHPSSRCVGLIQEAKDPGRGRKRSDGE
jgi:hypothetical protein